MRVGAQKGQNRSRDGSLEEHEEAVETARFQEGSTNDEAKKCKKAIEIVHPSRKTSFNSISENRTATPLMDSQEPNLSSSDISPLFIRSRQSLNPSLTPFNMADSKSINNSNSSLQPYDS
jgi:hypothetical protein